jgi:hypothetical protein
MRKRTSVSLLFSIFLLAIDAAGQPPVVDSAVRRDTSPPLRDIPLAPLERAVPRIHPIERIPTRGVAQRQVDTAEQLAPGPAAAFNIPFAPVSGLGKGLSTFQMTSVPPDTSGAAGTTQFVQAVNTSLLIIDKNTRAIQFGPALMKTLWRGFGGPCEAENDGDPIVVFDRLAGRWVLSQFQVTQGHSQCVAVSTTADALGSYHRYEFRYPAMNDYPKMGVWPDAYYVTFNMFDGLLGARACAYERAQMLTGAAARQVCFQLSDSWWSLMPADFSGSRQPPAGSPNPMLSLGADSRSLDLWHFRVNWANPAASTFGTGANHNPNVRIAVAPFNDACQGTSCIPQGGTSQRLDSLGDRLMMQAAYRRFTDHDSIVVNHSVSSSNATAAVRWYEIRNVLESPQLFQQGTFSPDNLSRWMGSIGMDAAGNILAGYSVANASTRTGIRAAGRRPGDPLGTLSNEVVVASGSKSQTGAGRWGDYSQLSIDPVDDCTFWFTTELMDAESGTFAWSTRIAAFRFSGCGEEITTAPGPRIVFVSTRDGNREVYSMLPDGTDVRRLTNNSADDFDPTPSPDGREIAFVSNRDGRPQVYLMNADGSNQRRLSSSTGNDDDPAWLPVP